MPSREKKSKDRDFFVNARRVVEQAIGERMDGKPLEKERPKNEAAVALSKLGAAKGGRARAAKLTSAKRKAIAKKAAMTRWHT
jgi:hypothetical protein